MGGLPDFVDFKDIVEPLRNLFKDEVRKVRSGARAFPGILVYRQPFPGPGLGIRIIGEVTAEKVRIVQDADAIYREEMDKAAASYKAENGKEAPWMPNQYFAALTNMRSVGVMGDERTLRLRCCSPCSPHGRLRMTAEARNPVCSPADRNEPDHQ